jgi:hypothetical protein
MSNRRQFIRQTAAFGLPPGEPKVGGNGTSIRCRQLVPLAMGEMGLRDSFQTRVAGRRSQPRQVWQVVAVGNESTGVGSWGRNDEEETSTSDWQKVYLKLLHVRQDAAAPRPARKPEPERLAVGRVVTSPTGRQAAKRVVIHVQAQPDLLHVVAARRATRCFAGHLNGGQKQRDQNANDGDDDQ